ncbi:type IX secretion system membrane protein PorP/SprF [Halosquirtibacter laminarini]|uniref:Type IX secretion system membrane protein PorP/SprF n=1 Tax=Halosquirtibacter laminarini TaxID=3374600 RepID=A0AC61NED2_9BACT|nr:type IX secretion system membrane protein PorP/SprF [Prolixibacteraceae bacterium]
MIRWLVLITFTFVLLVEEAQAQQDAMNSQYFFHKMLINPGYAGTNDEIQSTLAYRSQWIGVKGAPTTTVLMVDGPIQGYNLGLGAIFYTDKVGPEYSYSFYLNLSYQLELDHQTKLSFGLQGGILKDEIDWSKTIAKSLYDHKIYEQSNDSRYTPDLNLGLYLYSIRWYGGISIRHLFEEKYAYARSTQYESTFSLLSRHYYLFGGFVSPITRDRSIYIKPSFIVRYLSTTGYHGDITLDFLLQNQFWVGSTLRNLRSIIFMMAYNISKSVTIGYSYDYDLGALSQYGSNSHELMISYRLRDKKRIINPRQF